MCDSYICISAGSPILCKTHNHWCPSQTAPKFSAVRRAINEMRKRGHICMCAHAIQLFLRYGKGGTSTLGFVILTHILKFIYGLGYSCYFDHADSYCGKFFVIKILLGVANHRQSFGFGGKNHKISQFLRGQIFWLTKFSNSCTKLDLNCAPISVCLNQIKCMLFASKTVLLHQSRIY